jgi:DNA polymerase-3 subunit gamma/tau
MARSLNCVDGPTPDPCGACESCVALAPAGPGSIDVIEIDAASHGGVDDARDLRERAFYAPVAGRYKVYIIDEAHMVTSQGFNALLKLVEEPPPHLKFIFATTEPDKVIATIRSRTHHYPFRLMPPSVMSGLLTDILNDEDVSFEPAVIPLVVQAGGGSARDSLSILDQLLAGSDSSGIRYDRAVALLGYTDASLLDEIVTAFAAGDGAGVFRVVNRVIEGGHEPRRFATDVLDRFRDLIVLASVPNAGETGLLDAPPDRLDLMAGQAERFGIASLTRAAEIMSDGLDQMRGATSPRLLLELMCAQVLLPTAGTDEKALLARLERLERGGASLAPAAPVSLAPAAPVSLAPPAPAAPAPPAVAAVPAVAAPPATSAVPAAPAAPTTPSAPKAPTAPAAAASPSAPAASGGPAVSGSAESTESPAGWPGAGAVPPPSSEPADRPAAASAPAAPAAAAPPAAAPAGGPAASGGASAETVSRNWQAILDAIKRERRVAWMLLSNASVHSLEGNILTLRFARDGDVKGFTSSGCDADLQRVLAAQFGLNVKIRALSGNDPALAAGGGRSHPDAEPARPPAPPAGAGPARGWGTPEASAAALDSPAPSPAPESGPVPPAGPGPVGGQARSAADHQRPTAGDPPGAGNSVATATAPVATDSSWPDDPWPEDDSAPAGAAPAGATPGDSAPAARPGGGPRSAAAQAAHEAARAAGTQGPGRAQGTRGANGTGARRGANGTNGANGASGSNGHGGAGAEDLDIPDAEDMASPGQTEITGMDLIQRELGGKIIGEIED